MDRNFSNPGEKERKQVALLTEGVDRNSEVCKHRVIVAEVALLTEGVDRNAAGLQSNTGRTVALLAEGVDRNRSIAR